MEGSKSRKKIIGLVGGIGSGKSLVARQLASLGCAVISADEIAHQVLNEPEIRRQLVERWGRGILSSDGSVDRRALGKKVFVNPEELHRLEDLIHPRINVRRAELRVSYEADPEILAIVEDTPLLMEKNLDGECDVIILVDATQENRARRVEASRGWTEQELARREKTQLPLDIKANRADYVVDNNAGEAECLVHVRRVFSQIMQASDR